MNIDESCYVIAEIGVNHNGSVELAEQLIDAAATAGADAVKFQTFTADDLVTRRAAQAEYQQRNRGDDGSQHDMLQQLELSERDFARLLERCRERDIDFLSTPFGFESADLLERLGVHAFKVSSGDLTYHQFLSHLAAKGRPMIVSTGMATLAEVEGAVRAIEQTNSVPIILLHCVSDYPAAASSCNLASMATMRQAFGYPVGWSDHTLGSAVSCGAVALGAQVIEKHITLDRAMSGPDHAASMEPADFESFVASLRAVAAAVGDGVKRPRPEELRTAEVARRSIVSTRALPAGHVITAADVAVLRPGTGLPPDLLDVVIGIRLGQAIDADEPLTEHHLRG